jgi:hypothetical protein
MKQLTVFQLWYVYQQRTGTKSFIPFWAWVVGSGWQAHIDAAPSPTCSTSAPAPTMTPATHTAGGHRGSRRAS